MRGRWPILDRLTGRPRAISPIGYPIPAIVGCLRWLGRHVDPLFSRVGPFLWREEGNCIHALPLSIRLDPWQVHDRR